MARARPDIPVRIGVVIIILYIIFTLLYFTMLYIVSGIMFLVGPSCVILSHVLRTLKSCESCAAAGHGPYFFRALCTFNNLFSLALSMITEN